MSDRRPATGNGELAPRACSVREGEHAPLATGASPIAGVPSPPPANDGPAREAAIFALIDDLAALAAELYFAGRLGGDDEGSRPE
jgi:hypothetical protein